MEKSLWQKDNNLKLNNVVKEDLKTDVLVIGAGITGVSLCYNLINSNLDIILIDRGKCLNEATSKNTGKITYLQELKYQKICDNYNYKTAELYYDSQKEAIRIIKRNIKENGIDCEFQRSDSITFTCDESEIPNFIKEETILKRMGVNFSNKSVYLENKNIKKLILVKNTYDFNPVKYLKGLIKRIKKSNNIRIYENSCATKIKKEDGYYVVFVNEKQIKTKKIVLACNYPFFTIPGFIPLKTYVERSYLSATKVNDTKNINGITSNYPTVSFRYYKQNDDKYFIYLSNSSKISDKLNYKKNYDDLILEVKKITGKNPSYKWTNMDVMTNDGLPIIGKISNDEKNVFIATGYNTWGITNGTIAGKILYDLINNKKNKYKDLFDPTRVVNYHDLASFFKNTMISSLKAYTLNFVKKNPSWYKNKAIITKINGKRVGIFFDSKGQKHIVSNICPHLKCFLTFNEVDKTWDCPCHGSRFDIDGNAIKGPACYNIKIDEIK